MTEQTYDNMEIKEETNSHNILNHIPISIRIAIICYVLGIYLGSMDLMVNNNGDSILFMLWIVPQLCFISIMCGAFIGTICRMIFKKEEKKNED